MGLNTEDRWIIALLILSFIGVVSAALIKDPRPIGISVFIIVPFLIHAWRHTRSARLRWLLIFGAVAAFGELWADWIHVEYFIRWRIKIILDLVSDQQCLTFKES